MKEISENLLKKLYSNTPPQAGIKISIKKTNREYDGSQYNYNEQEVVSFREKDITNVSFSQNVDITGSELPSIKLSWEKNFFGELDEKLNPILDYELYERMAVDFSIIYKFSTYLSWKNVQEENLSWKNIYDNSKTWRDLFYDQKKEEEVKTKRTFLANPPKFESGKIKFESRDLLYFLSGKTLQRTSFITIDGEQAPTTREELISFILGEESLRLYDSNDKSFDVALSNTTFENITTRKNNLWENQIFVGTAKDVIRNCLSPICYFVDFKEDGSLYVKNADFSIIQGEHDIKRKILLKNQQEYPQVTMGKDISNYIFDSSTFFVDYDNPYEVSPSLVSIEGGEGYVSYVFYTKEPSTRYAKDGSYYPEIGTDHSVFESLENVRYDIKGNSYPSFDLRLYGIKQKSSTIIHKINEKGTEFKESNPFNAFGLQGTRNFALQRANFLSEYYNSNNSSLVVKCFGDASIEPLDVVSVETNIKNRETKERVSKNGIVTSLDLVYNGVIKQTVSVHEIDLY